MTRPFVSESGSLAVTCGPEVTTRVVSRLRDQTEECFITEVGKLRPRGQMWPDELYNLAQRNLHNNISKSQMKRAVLLIG